MRTTTRVAALALAAAVLGTERGRGALGSVLISLGASLIPEAPLDPARDARIRGAVMAGVCGHQPDRRNGHHRPPL